MTTPHMTKPHTSKSSMKKSNKGEGLLKSSTSIKMLCFRCIVLRKFWYGFYNIVVFYHYCVDFTSILGCFYIWQLFW